jgi:receptor protein-tyrosine kinase
MELQQYIALLKRRLWLVVLGGVIAAGVAFAVSRSQTPIYRATSRLLISEGSSPTSNGNYSSLTSLARSYIERLTNYEVLTDVIDSLGLTMSADHLRNAIDVSLINNTELISLSVEDNSQIR